MNKLLMILALLLLAPLYLIVSFLGIYEFYKPKEDEITATKWPLFEIVENQGRTTNITHWIPLPESPKEQL